MLTLLPTAALRKNPLERPTVLDMVHHPWIELFRARRSMRQLPIPGSAQPASPAPMSTAATRNHEAAQAAHSSSSSSNNRKAPNKCMTQGQLVVPSLPSPFKKIAGDLGLGMGDDMKVNASAASSPALVHAMNGLALTTPPTTETISRSSTGELTPTHQPLSFFNRSNTSNLSKVSPLNQAKSSSKVSFSLPPLADGFSRSASKDLH